MADEPVAGKIANAAGAVTQETIEQGKAAARAGVAGIGNGVEQALALIGAAREILASGVENIGDFVDESSESAVRNAQEFTGEAEAALQKALAPSDDTEEAK